MSISDELFRAILAMDAYNRGYSAGVNISGSAIGAAELRLGTNADTDPAAVAASFYGQSYTWNGQTVISYRGTDQANIDIATGYGPATGGIYSEQAKMAVEFYKTVAAASGAGSPRTANIILTGHSMGGGLRGARAGSPWAAGAYGMRYGIDRAQLRAANGNSPSTGRLSA